MKHFFVLLAASILLGVATSQCQATPATSSLKFQFTVSPIFKIQVDKVQAVFGPANPGDVFVPGQYFPDPGSLTNRVRVTVQSNLGTPWQVSVNGASHLIDQVNHENQLDISSLKWNVVFSEFGNTHPAPGTVARGDAWTPLTLSPVLAYTSSELDKINIEKDGKPGTNLDTQFFAFIPKNAKPGDYTTTIVFTLTE